MSGEKTRREIRASEKSKARLINRSIAFIDSILWDGGMEEFCIDMDKLVDHLILREDFEETLA